MQDALRQTVRDRGRVRPADADVSFETPTRRWLDALARPTVGMFLFDARENTELRATAYQTERGATHAVHRVPPRRFDLHYLVSVVAADPADEHALFWRVLVTLAQQSVLPNAALLEGTRFRDVPIHARIAAPDQSARPLDLWSALDAPPRPSLVYVVTVPVDLDIEVTAPLVLSHTSRVRSAGAPDGGEGLTRIGGVVRGRDGEPVAGAAVAPALGGPEACTGPDGRFVLERVPGGDVALRVARAGAAPAVVTVPVPPAALDSYDIVLD